MEETPKVAAVQSTLMHSEHNMVPMGTNSIQPVGHRENVLWSELVTLLLIIILVIVLIVLSLTSVVFHQVSKTKTECTNSFSTTSSDHPQTTTISPQIQEIVADFVIVGGGSAGCVLAARLAEYGFETLLISSGSNDTLNPLMRQQSLFSQLHLTPHFKHYLPLNPSADLNNRTMDMRVWNTLGGSSINNGGMERLMTNEWNYFINTTGDRSFHYENMTRYYEMVENFTSDLPLSFAGIHGNNGPIKITQAHDTVFNSVWKNVADELNETFTNDLAGTIDHGFSFEPSVYTNGLRSWSGDAYLTPIMAKYPNLKVLTGATVTKFDVNEESKLVKNVLFVSSDGLFSAIARKEYILSAGTFYSPHLLMLSGIGDREILEQNNIPVKHELKQVGKNLMDNEVVVVEYETTNFSIGQCIPVALINSQSRTTNTNPNTFFILKMDNETKHLYVVIFNGSPKSPVGSISLYNSNPLAPPKISLNYLKDQKDIETLIDGINYVRMVFATNAMTQFAQMNESLPGLKANLSTYVRDTLIPGYHFIGTCSIGQDAQNSVVDSHFKVHGIGNLRVVDASVFPAGFVSKTGPCLTVYALAEKAANMLRQEHS